MSPSDQARARVPTPQSPRNLACIPPQTKPLAEKIPISAPRSAATPATQLPQQKLRPPPFPSGVVPTPARVPGAPTPCTKPESTPGHSQAQHRRANPSQNNNRRKRRHTRHRAGNRSRMNPMEKMPLSQRPAESALIITRRERSPRHRSRSRPPIQQTIHGVNQPNHQPQRRHFRV